MSNLTIEQTPTGWHIEGVAHYSPHPFTADLNLCPCDGKGKEWKATEPCAGGYHVPHVRLFLERLAATYWGKTEVPEVPFDASKVKA